MVSRITLDGATFPLGILKLSDLNDTFDELVRLVEEGY